MKREQFEQMLEKASKSVQALNRDLARVCPTRQELYHEDARRRALNSSINGPNENSSSQSCSKLESTICDESLAAQERKKRNSGRFRVRIVCFRQRLTDPDNICTKFFVDCLRYAEIIPDDTCQYIELTVSQEKVKHRFEQRTELLVDRC